MPFGKQVVKVEQRDLVEALAGGLDHQAPGGARQRLRVVRGQGRGGDDGGAADGAPDVGEVTLAAARRTVDGEDPGGPVGPAVEPGHRLGVAGRDQEVLVAERRPLSEVEGELLGAHRSGSGPGAGGSPPGPR